MYLQIVGTKWTLWLNSFAWLVQTAFVGLQKSEATIFTKTEQTKAYKGKSWIWFVHEIRDFSWAFEFLIACKGSAHLSFGTGTHATS